MVKRLDWIVREIRTPKEVVLILIGLSPFLVFFGYIFFHGLFSTHNSRACAREKAYLNQASYGIVHNINSRKFGRGIDVIYLDEGEYFIADYLLRQNNYTLAIGDTVEKVRQNLDIIIRPKRGGSIVKLSLDQGCNQEL